jgi:hypothetical protein
MAMSHMLNENNANSAQAAYINRACREEKPGIKEHDMAS